MYHTCLFPERSSDDTFHLWNWFIPDSKSILSYFKLYFVPCASMCQIHLPQLTASDVTRYRDSRPLGECFPKCHIDKLILQMSFSFSFFRVFLQTLMQSRTDVLFDVKNTHSNWNRNTKTHVTKTVSTSVFMNCLCFHCVSLTVVRWLQHKAISHSGA